MQDSPIWTSLAFAVQIPSFVRILKKKIPHLAASYKQHVHKMRVVTSQQLHYLQNIFWINTCVITLSNEFPCAKQTETEQTADENREWIPQLNTPWAFSTETAVRTVTDTSYSHFNHYDRKYIGGNYLKWVILYQNIDLEFFLIQNPHYRPELVSKSIRMKLNRTVFLLPLLQTVFAMLLSSSIRMFLMLSN